MKTPSHSPLLFLACLFLFSLNTKAQSWEKTFAFNVNGLSKGFDLVETTDGGFIMCGELDLPTGAPRHYTCAVKADANGDEVWSRFYNYNDISQDEAKALAPTPDGGFLIAGTAMLNYAQVLKISAAGDSLWRKEYALNGPTKAESIIPNPNGSGFILAGSKLIFPSTETSFWIAGIDNEGELLWEQNYPDFTDIGTLGMDIKATANGNLLIVGVSQGSQVGLLKTNANGEQIWAKKYPLSTADWGIALEEMTNGEILLGGSSTGFAGTSPFLLHLDADGNEIDQPVIDVVNFGAVSDIEKTSDGGYILTGSGYSFWNGIDTGPGFILKLNTDLEPQWDSVLSNNQTQGTAIMETADGGFIMSGYNETGMLLKRIADMTNSNENVLLENELAVSVYPNPSTDKITFEFPIEFLTADLSLELYSQEGRLVRTQMVDDEVLLLEGLAAGTYSYVVRNRNGEVKTGLVVRM
ncbi:MAG: hypothetical protein ACI8YQ_002414 [Polaribacter sp.]|jgi:hypothetical protein